MKWIRTECAEIMTEEEFENSIGYKIKTQGDNLIDVLEVDDIIISKTGVTVIVDAFDLRVKYFDMKIIVKVITHEQYMPLAQEVK